MEDQLESVDMKSKAKKYQLKEFFERKRSLTFRCLQQAADLREWETAEEGGAGRVQAGPDLHVRQEGQGRNDHQRRGPGHSRGRVWECRSQGWDLHPAVQAGRDSTEWQTSRMFSIFRWATIPGGRVWGGAGSCLPSVSASSLRQTLSSPTCWDSSRSTGTPTWTFPRWAGGPYMSR